MKRSLSLLACGTLLALLPAGCEKPFAEAEATTPPPRKKSAPVKENLDPEELAQAEALQPSKDPILVSRETFCQKISKAFQNGEYETLDVTATSLWKSNPVFANGAWKIVAFYNGLNGLEDDDPEAKWQEAAQRFHQWMASRPQSATARIAYADFLTSYAWKARGSGFADTVSEEGWRLFAERIRLASDILSAARGLPDIDPFFWHTAFVVARAQAWPRENYDSVFAEAKAFAPRYWGYDVERATWLLPRWHGTEGEWEAYALEAAEKPEGLGAETYARIVIRMRPYYTNVFRDSQASWPKTREGLELMLKRYPASLEVASHAAMLASMGHDRQLAQAMFERLGDTYLPEVWRSKKRFVHFRKWAKTGAW